MKKLAAIVLGFRISKRQQVTDWEAEQLTEAQQIYAATDAWVCYQIYRNCVTGMKNQDIDVRKIAKYLPSWRKYETSGTN